MSKRTKEIEAAIIIYILNRSEGKMVSSSDRDFCLWLCKKAGSKSDDFEAVARRYLKRMWDKGLLRRWKSPPAYNGWAGVRMTEWWMYEVKRQ